MLLALGGCGSSDRDRDRGRDRDSDRSDRSDRDDRDRRSDRERDDRPDGDPLASAANTASPPASSQAPQPRTWRGTYTCGQGQTGLEVTLRPVSRGNVEGTFSFFPIPSNPSVPRGCFQVTGRMSETGAFETSAGQWVRQPPGYQTVNLSGQIGASGKWTGRVVGAGGVCTAFALDPAPAPQETCQ